MSGLFRNILSEDAGFIAFDEKSHEWMQSKNSPGGVELNLSKISYEVIDVDYSEIKDLETCTEQDSTYLLDKFKDGFIIKLDIKKLTGIFLYLRITGEKKSFNNNWSIEDFLTVLVQSSKSQKEKQFRFLTRPFDYIFKDQFKHNLYLNVESFGKNKLIKIPLLQFQTWGVIFKFFQTMNEKGWNEDEKYPYGYEINTFKKKLSVLHYQKYAKTKLESLPKVYALRTGWSMALDTVLTGFCSQISQLQIDYTEEKFLTIKELLDKIKLIDPNKFSYKIFEEVFKFCKKLNELSSEELEEKLILTHPWNILDDEDFEFKVEKKQSDLIIFSNMLAKVYYLIYKTNYGLSQIDGTNIDHSDFTLSDAYNYWAANQIYLYKSPHVKNYYVPAIIENESLVNDDDEFKQRVWFGGNLINIDTDQSIDEEVSHILKEAVKNKLYTIPYGAAVEIKDPIFKYIQVFESKNKVEFFVFDENSRYLYEELSLFLDEPKFSNLIFDANTFRSESNEEKLKHKKNFHTIFATLVRDFWVVIERQRNLGPIRSVYFNHKEKSLNIKRIIYLPRIKYVGPKDDTRIKNELKLLKSSKGGWRQHSIMRLQDGFKPSPLQLLLAQKNGVTVPEGFTYKKAHSWGQRNKSENEIIYRSRNLTGMFFISEHDKKIAEEIVDMSWVSFEEYCVEVIENFGWNKTVTRPIDGGIDIEAYKDNKKGEVIRLFAQCKHQKRNIQTNILREIIGSKKIENKDYQTELMVITSGKFSSGCKEIAQKENIQLIDGNDLMNLAKK